MKDDAEIIKALKCCKSNKCAECPIKYECRGNKIRATLIISAFDLINHQKAEIERLQKHNAYAARKHYNDGVKDFAKYLSSYPLYPVDLGDNRLVLEPQEVDYIVQKLTGGTE